MRVLQVITSLRTGGAEKLMLDLVPLLENEGHEVHLLLMDGTMTTFYRQALERGIKVHHLEVGGNIYSPRKLLKLLPWLRRFDVVHTHNTPAQLFAALGSVLCSVVLCTTEHTTSNRRRGSRWYAVFDRWMYSRYRKVVCISDGTEQQLRVHLGNRSDKILTIHNGIDTAAFHTAVPVALGGEDEVKIIQVATRWLN